MCKITLVVMKLHSRIHREKRTKWCHNFGLIMSKLLIGKLTSLDKQTLHPIITKPDSKIRQFSFIFQLERKITAVICQNAEY